MKNAIKNLLRCQAGQALVELALTVPLLFLLVIGAGEIARMAYYAIITENAAHAAALFAAQNAITASDTTDITTVADSEASSIGGSKAITVSPPNYSCTCFNPKAGTNSTMTTCSASCPSPDTVLESVQVNTQSKVATWFHYPGLAGSTFTVYGSATMSVGQ